MILYAVGELLFYEIQH